MARIHEVISACDAACSSSDSEGEMTSRQKGSERPRASRTWTA